MTKDPVGGGHPRKRGTTSVFGGCCLTAFPGCDSLRDRARLRRDMPRLIIEFQNASRDVPLKEGRHTLGRSKKCEIFIPDSNLSREHCCFVVAADGCVLEDLGSMNGTQVNGKKIDKRQALSPGDAVRVGSVLVHFESKRAAATTREVKKSTVRAAKVAKTGAAAARRGRPIKDFSFWSGGGGGAAKVAGAVVAVLLVGGAAFGGLKLLGRGGPQGDPKNLLKSNPSFERGEAGWRLASGTATTVAVEVGAAPHGERFLTVNKGSGDFTVEIADADDTIAVGPGDGGLQVSAQVRFDSFSDYVALKVTWLRKPGGLPVLEAYSAPVTGATGWTALSGTFDAPPRATAARLSIVAAGGPGRFMIDHVRAEAGGAAAMAMTAVGDDYAVGHAGSGALIVQRGKRMLLANVQTRSTNRARGTAEPMTLTRATSGPRAGGWEVGGEMLTPSEAHPSAAWKLSAHAEDGGLSLAGEWEAAARGTFDEVELELTLVEAQLESPRGSGLHSRVEFARGGERYRLEFPLTVDVRIEEVEGDVRVTTVWPAGALAGAAAVACRLSPADLGEVDARRRLDRELARAREEKRPGPVADALRELVGAIEDARQSEPLEKELQTLRADERREYGAIQRGLSEAILSGDPGRRAAALDAISDFRLRYESRTFAEHLAALAERVDALSPETEADGAARRRMMLTRARRYQEWGMAALAERVLRSIVDQYPETAEAEEARGLLGGS